MINRLVKSMFSDQSILTFSFNVLRRYEHNINNGTYFLYHIKSKEMWTGNRSSFEMLNIIDGKKRLKDIYRESQLVFSDFSINDIKNSINCILNELIAKNFIIILEK